MLFRSDAATGRADPACCIVLCLLKSLDLASNKLLHPFLDILVSRRIVTPLHLKPRNLLAWVEDNCRIIVGSLVDELLPILVHLLLAILEGILGVQLLCGAEVA